MLNVRVPRRAGRTLDLHLWWRVLIQARPATYTAFAEVSMRSARGGPQVAVGGVAAASSVYGAGYEASKAFDGNLATWWGDNGGAAPAWINYQFPQKVELLEVAITYGPSGWNGIPTSLAFQMSDDGVQWFTRWQVNPVGAWVAGATKVFTR